MSREASSPSRSQRLISKLFRSKSSSIINDGIFPSDSVSVSNQPLLVGSDPVKAAASLEYEKFGKRVSSDPVKTAASMEYDTFGKLMDKAKTMPPEEFRKYLKEFREKEEAKYRKFGGGVAGGGDWVWRGEKAVRGDYIV
jgi:hypothetical protein